MLDLACGSGRHARFLAAAGHPVLAVDRDAAALAEARGAGIATLQVDLESRGGLVQWPFEAGRFSGIVVTNYLHRPLFPHIVASLAPGGVLIYETFARGNERFGKPSNPDFLLWPGELLNLAQTGVPDPLRIIAFEDGSWEPPGRVVPAQLSLLTIPTCEATAVRLRSESASVGRFGLGAHLDVKRPNRGSGG